MSASTCPACGSWVRLVKPPRHQEGQLPDRLPLHRTGRSVGPICRGSGRVAPLYPKDSAS